jgi:hypothetical protein
MPTRVGSDPLGKVDKLEAADADCPAHQKVRPINPRIRSEILANDAAGFTQRKIAGGGGGQWGGKLRHVLFGMDSNQPAAARLKCDRKV